MKTMKQSLQEKTYQLIKQRIQDEVYKANEFIDEAAIAKELGCSRTPVREALIKLSQHNFVKIIPKRGIQVVLCDERSVNYLYEARTVVEPAMVRLYGSQIPKSELRTLYNTLLIQEKSNSVEETAITLDEPHNIIRQYCTNPYLNDSFDMVTEQLNRKKVAVGLVAVSGVEHFEDRNLQDHIEIVKRMMDGQFEEAATLLKCHIEFVHQSLQKYWARK